METLLLIPGCGHFKLPIPDGNPDHWLCGKDNVSKTEECRGHSERTRGNGNCCICSEKDLVKKDLVKNDLGKKET